MIYGIGDERGLGPRIWAAAGWARGILRSEVSFKRPDSGGAKGVAPKQKGRWTYIPPSGAVE